MKTRFYLFIGALIFIVILVGIGVAASQPTPPAPTPTPQPPTPTPSSTVTVTIENGIGIQTISIYNINTGQTYIATMTSLPYSFNCTRENYLQISVTTQPGYRWNSWTFNPMGIPVSANPAIIRVSENNIYGNLVANNQIYMTPNCLMLAQPSTTEEPIG